jgi:hypothetical protein
MKRIQILLAGMLVICAALAAPTATQAHCFGKCRHYWRHNQWGYVGMIRGSWGRGGIADAPWVGGSIFGVSSYGPYLYGLYPD